jgi:hypothetical protein
MPHAIYSCKQLFDALHVNEDGRNHVDTVRGPEGRLAKNSEMARRSGNCSGVPCLFCCDTSVPRRSKYCKPIWRILIGCIKWWSRYVDSVVVTN